MKLFVDIIAYGLYALAIFGIAGSLLQLLSNPEEFSPVSLFVGIVLIAACHQHFRKRKEQKMTVEQQAK